MNEKKIASIIQDLISELPARQREVIEKRFGLSKGKKRMTLELIGQDYGVTRERIRQIENSAKSLILDTNKIISKMNSVVASLEKTIDSFGGIVSESDLMEKYTNKQDTVDHLNFVLQLSKPFVDVKDDKFGEKIWYTNKDSYSSFTKSLEKLYKNIKTDELLTEEEIVNRFMDKLSKETINKNLLKKDNVKRLVKLSNKIGHNDLGQWGKTESRNISTKGVKDYAYLILNESGEATHFKELAKIVSKRFNRKVNIATIHNELIKDDRFILIGRGKYALKEWGIFSGETVKNVIIKFLKKHKNGASKEDILKEVLKQKDVRKQTVMVNLSYKEFKRSGDGKYVLV